MQRGVCSVAIFSVSVHDCIAARPLQPSAGQSHMQSGSVAVCSLQCAICVACSVSVLSNLKYAMLVHCAQYPLSTLNVFALYHLSRPNLKDTIAAEPQITDHGIGDDDDKKLDKKLKIIGYTKMMMVMMVIMMMATINRMNGMIMIIKKEEVDRWQLSLI